MIDRDGHDPIMIKFKNDAEKEEWMSSIMNIYLKRYDSSNYCAVRYYFGIN